MKNRKREICTSGSVRGEGGNLLTYSAARERSGVADGRASAAVGSENFGGVLESEVRPVSVPNGRAVDPEIGERVLGAT